MNNGTETNTGIKTRTQARINETCALIGDGPASILAGLVRGYRSNEISGEKAGEVFLALKKCVEDAQANYHAAIAQPEPRASTKPRVVL
jgi:hypothetical protein